MNISKTKQRLKKIKPLLKAYRQIKKLLDPTFGKTETYLDIRNRLEKEDRENALSVNGLINLHEKLNELKLAQLKNWNSFVYCAGYFYQGYNRIGIHGIKPTEQRIRNYDIFDYLTREKSVLDIGSNSGFMSCYLSEFTKEVEGIELNPYLVKMGEITANYLKLTNVSFIIGDFTKHKFIKKYDIVFSLSNHFTIDGNLNIDFESYVSKIFNIINEGGILFFESHNLNGDDKDLELKFKIASKYFTLVKYKMVRAFFPQDIDKLFAIFEKRNLSGSIQESNFNLEIAKRKYNY